jgi:hypothetical protein
MFLTAERLAASALQILSIHLMLSCSAGGLMKCRNGVTSAAFPKPGLP